MRIILIVLISISFIACSKNRGNNQPPAAVDTLSAGWKKVALPSPQGGSDVFFINNTTGFAVGNNVISRSTDGGNTWQKVYQSAAGFVNIAMSSTMNAVFTTSGSGSTKLISTSDGGNSFDSVIINDGITDAFLVSSTIGYAIGQQFWKTTNGGRNWTSIFDFSSIPSGYRSLHFLNDQVGWWAGTGGVYNTINGGTTWTAQPVSVFSLGTGSIYFTDANNGYLAGDNSVGKTINGGTAWTKIHTLSGAYHDIHFITTTTGYVTDNQSIYKTIDGGVTWTKEVRLANSMIVEIHFTDVNHGWAVYNGYVLKFEK